MNVKTFMKRRNDMKTEGKIRIAVFAVIMLIFIYLSVGYVYEYGLGRTDLRYVPEAENVIIIDGSDFTPIFRLMGMGFNGAMSFVMSIIYALVIVIASLIFLIPFRLIGLGKKRAVSVGEYIIVRRIYIAALILSVIIGGILSRFYGIIPLIVYNAIWALMTLAMCIIPMKKMSERSNSNE